MKVDSVKQFVALRVSLKNEKARLEARLAEINRALGEVRSAAPSRNSRLGGRERARNAMSLKEAVTRVTRSKPMTRQEILEAIKKVGYKFTAKDPMNSLSVTLYTKGNFKNRNGKFSPLK